MPSRAEPPRTGAALLASLLLVLSAAAASLRAAPKEERQLPWSLKPLERPQIPRRRAGTWERTPIDAFILARLEEKGIAPSSAAGKADLLRRATLDLLGLLPEPEEVDAYLADESPDAFDRTADRLLASPRHGERWARHWLDLARYAETEGFKSDEVRPSAWRYRDYVIRSLNADKPYDHFLKEQIAGDELWPEDSDARIATGFNRHYPDESNARNLMQRRQEILNDITDTAAQVFTGLTFGCARCHDHKYDPITQADYYRFQAFFANVRATDDLPLVPAEGLRRHRERMAVWEEQAGGILSEMRAIEAVKRQEIATDNFDKFPPEIQEAISKPAAERTPIQWQMYYKALPYLEPDPGVVAGAIAGKAKERWQALKAELSKYDPLHPGELAVGTGIIDAGREAPKTFILAGGVYNAPEAEVEPGFPAVLASHSPHVEPPAGRDTTGRRSALAGWLSAPDNPLASRALANRLWHYHFGRGIAATPNDLGAMGEPPTHPELLDWLATELVRSGWSLKRLHRLIVTSSVYAQDSIHRADRARQDPENRLVWRFPRHRVEGEVLRDAALEVAGLLNLAIGGPSIFPELPGGMDGHGKWSPSKDPASRNRRSVYVFVRRNLRYPLFEAFDMPDTHETCGRRSVTITAPQALLLLNDKLPIEWSRAFAARVAASTADRSDQVRLAYRIAYARLPDAGELTAALSFLEDQLAILAGRPGAAPAPERAALGDLCHVLLNSSEFVYRD